MSFIQSFLEPQPNLAWTFDASSNIDSINKLSPNGISQGSTSQVQGNVTLVNTVNGVSDTAISFPGSTGSYLNLGANSSAHFDTSISNMFIEAWVNFNENAYTEYIIGILNIAAGTNDDWGLRVDGTYHYFMFYHYNTANASTAVGGLSTVTINTWYHVAVSFTTSGYIYLYVNGVLQGSASIGGTPRYTAASSVFVGTPSPLPSGWVATNAYIRDLRVVKGGSVPTGSTITPISAPFSYASPTYVASMGTTVYTLLGQYITYPSGKYLKGLAIRNYITVDASSTNMSYPLTSYNLTSTVGITISFWANCDILHATGYGCLVGFTSTDASPMYFDICDVASGTSVFQFYCQNGKPTPSTNTFTIISSVTNVALSWFHISLSINNNKLVTLYINGVSTGTPVTLVNDFTIANLYLGRSGQYNGHSSSAIIDDLRIYNSCLTSTQIQSIYTQNAVPAVNFNLNPQNAYGWNFENTRTDYVKGLNPTTVNGTPTYVTGKYGTGINFPNSTNTGAVNAANSLYYNVSLNSATGYTFTFWVNFNIGGVFAQVFLSIGDGSGNRICYIYLNASNKFILGEQTGGGDINYNNASFSTNTWYHVAVVIYNGTRSLYINGVAANNTLNAVSTITGTQGSFILGGDFLSVNNFSSWCSYDDLRIYNTALSTTQINAIYATQGMQSQGLKSSSITLAGGNTSQVINGYRINTFTTVGTQTFTTNQAITAQILIVGGGGGGGAPGDRSGGGGGGGGVVYYASQNIPAGTYTVTVGGGGTGASAGATGTNGGQGGNSSISGLGLTTAIGGAGGEATSVATSGGSAGGNYHNASSATSTYTSGQGNAGGTGYDGGQPSPWAAGGGGGAGTVGGNASASGAGSGGVGILYSISGTPTYYGGGGGGGVQSSAGSIGRGIGGNGGGGNGAVIINTSSSQFTSTPGTDGLGGGGGGGANNGTNAPYNSGANGGSGIVIIAYQNNNYKMTGAPLFAQLSSAATSSAVSAFSLRAVNGVTARAVQVRRSSDNATQDFYADRLGNLLTVPISGQTLANWLGGATGYVTYWYDQSGKNNHSSQGTTAQQPIIQRATKGTGYACLFSGGQQLIGMSHSVLTNTNYSFSVIERRNTAGGFYPLISSGNVAATDKNLTLAYRNNTTLTHAQWGDDINYTITGYAGTNEPLHYWTGTQSSTNGRIGYSGNTQIYNDSTKKNLLLSTSGNFIIGGDIEDVPNYYYYYGEIYEVLIFTQSLYDIDGTNTINTIYNNQLSQYGT